MTLFENNDLNAHNKAWSKIEEEEQDIIEQVCMTHAFGFNGKKPRVT